MGKAKFCIIVWDLGSNAITFYVWWKLPYVIGQSHKIANCTLLTDIFSSTTVNIERIVAELIVWVRGLKKKSIRTKLLLWNFSHAFIVLVTLLRVGEESIFLRTSEQEVWKQENEKLLSWVCSWVCMVRGAGSPSWNKCQGWAVSDNLAGQSVRRVSSLAKGYECFLSQVSWFHFKTV